MILSHLYSLHACIFAHNLVSLDASQHDYVKILVKKDNIGCSINTTPTRMARRSRVSATRHHRVFAQIPYNTRFGTRRSVQLVLAMSIRLAVRAGLVRRLSEQS